LKAVAENDIRKLEIAEELILGIGGRQDAIPV
jgi:hypothetical protein